MAQENQALIQLLQAVIGQLGGSPAAGRAAAGIAPPGPDAPTPQKAQPAYTPPTEDEMAAKRQMYAQHGLPAPEKLHFMQELANFMAGMKFRQRAMQSALSGKAGLFGDEGDILPGVGNVPGSLGSYA